MTYIPKPKVIHPSAPRNRLGLTARDYEGALSTLCAGCGHDSVTAAIVRAAFEANVEPHLVAKMSGIGCSSKTPAYFIGGAHGFNSVHGRMPSVTTGANAAHRNLKYLAVSGDGDTASIGLGQFAHAIRRRLNMLYIVENNGCYGLTKGQFSATTDPQSKNKNGIAAEMPAIDLATFAIQLGAGFVARSFSGDKPQLVELIKAGLDYKGFALIDVISPCVTFNNHEGSTKSYEYTRQHDVEITHVDYVPHRQEILADYDPSGAAEIVLHDDSVIRLRKIDPQYSLSSRPTAIDYLYKMSERGEIPTGLLYLDQTQHEMHDLLNTVPIPLRDLTEEELSPGKNNLNQLQRAWR